MSDLDVFNEVYGSATVSPAPVTAGNPTVIKISADSDIFDQVYSAPSRTSGLNPASAQVGKGLAFGYFDELQGLETRAQNSIRNALGLDTGMSNDQAYAKRVADLRATDTAYEAANPYTSMALQGVGAIAPALIPGGAALLGAKAATTAPRVGTGLAKTLFGVGMKEAPTLGQLAKMGAAQGALYGSGEANDGNRLAGAAIGGGVGAVAAPLIGKTLEKAVGGAADFAANRGWIGGKGLASTGAERGSFSLTPGGTSYTPEELYLAQQLKNTPIEKVIGGASEMSAAVGKDIPLFLPEALNSPKVNRNARFIANFEPSMEFSQSAIAGRTAGAEERATQLFNAVSDEANPFTGASSIRDAATEILEAAKKERADLVKPLYTAAYAAPEGQGSLLAGKPKAARVNDPELRTLLEKDQIVTSAISTLRKTANNADLPDNSLELLVKARGEIFDRAEAATAKGNPTQALDIMDTYKRLNSILQKNEKLKVADQAFAAASGKVDELEGSFVKNLSKISDDKVNNVSQIFNLPSEQIGKLRETFIQAGKLDEWNAGIRSHLQGVAEGSREGKNFTDKIFNTTTLEKKLQAALGDSYESVAKGLDFENRFFKGNKEYFAGSSTAGNLAEEQSTKEILGVVSNLRAGNYTAAIMEMFKHDMPESLAQEVSQIYFGPKRGAEAIEKILPLLQQYAANKAVATSIGKGSAGLGSRGLADKAASISDQASQVSQSPLAKRPSSSALGLKESKGTTTRQQLPNQLESISPSSNSTPRSATNPEDFSAVQNTSLNSKLEDDVRRQEFDAALEASKQPEVKLTPIPSQLEGLSKQERIKKVADFVKQQPPLIQAVILGESSGDALAVSPTGPRGLMGLAKIIRDAYGGGNGFDPRKNVKAGTAFLQDLASKYSDPRIVLASYNQGESVINKAIKRAGLDPKTADWESIKPLLPTEEGRKYPDYIIGHLNKITQA